MDAVEWGVIIAMIGVLGIMIYAVVWFLGIINSDEDSENK